MNQILFFLSFRLATSSISDDEMPLALRGVVRVLYNNSM